MIQLKLEPAKLTLVCMCSEQEISIALEITKSQFAKSEGDVKLLEQELESMQSNMAALKDQHSSEMQAARLAWRDEKKALAQSLRDEQDLRESERRALDMRHRQEMTWVYVNVV